ncbi:MAG: hypothetical protein EU539_02405 [Promethearchaeota archaeon]|nr:MAG: hypothetical protein EU539_02405 [Candidatus Lokiarchaeota archaeon]
MAIQLTPEEFIQGFSSLLFSVISIMVGLLLIIRYLQYRQNTLLLAGLTWCLIASTWYTGGINFIYVLITGTSISDEAYFLCYLFVPFTLTLWISLFTVLKNIQKRKLILGFLIIQGIIYEIILLYFIFTDLSVVGYKEGLFNDELTLPFSIYMIVILIIAIITGLWFALDSMKSEKKDIKLKGKFLTAAWLSFVIGAALDTGLVSLTPLLLIITRLILISSAFEFYFGFFLPEWLKRLLIKED